MAACPPKQQQQPQPIAKGTKREWKLFHACSSHWTRNCKMREKRKFQSLCCLLAMQPMNMYAEYCWTGPSSNWGRFNGLYTVPDTAHCSFVCTVLLRWKQNGRWRLRLWTWWSADPPEDRNVLLGNWPSSFTPLAVDRQAQHSTPLIYRWPCPKFQPWSLYNISMKSVRNLGIHTIYTSTCRDLRICVGRDSSHSWKKGNWSQREKV